MGDKSETVSRQAETPQRKTSNIRVTGREKKIHVTRTKNFFMVETNTKANKARGSIAVNALCYQPEGHGFETR
jgi:hypothetical protein